MAITLSVVQSPGKLSVYAGNASGNLVAIIDHIVLSVDTGGSSWHTWHYEDDFYLGTARVSPGWVGLMVQIAYAGGTPATASAKAAYWEVDELAASTPVAIS